MAVGPGQDTTQGDAVAVHHAGAFQALLAPVNRRAPRDLAQITAECVQLRRQW